MTDHVFLCALNRGAYTGLRDFEVRGVPYFLPYPAAYATTYIACKLLRKHRSSAFSSFSIDSQAIGDPSGRCIRGFALEIHQPSPEAQTHITGLWRCMRWLHPRSCLGDVSIQVSLAVNTDPEPPGAAYGGCIPIFFSEIGEYRSSQLGYCTTSHWRCMRWLHNHLFLGDTSIQVSPA